jgi:hypothetical protein
MIQLLTVIIPGDVAARFTRAVGRAGGGLARFGPAPRQWPGRAKAVRATGIASGGQQWREPGPGQLDSRKLASMPNPLCPCERGWFCAQHPGQRLGHDGCRASGSPCMNTTCPYGRENLRLLDSGVGLGAEFADSPPVPDAET